MSEAIELSLLGACADAVCKRTHSVCANVSFVICATSWNQAHSGAALRDRAVPSRERVAALSCSIQPN